MGEKRKYPRVGISFPIEYDLLPRRNYFYTVTKDLSEGGAKILTDKFIPKGNDVKVNINLINKMVNLKAKVIWCNKERIGERYSVGLRFTEVNKNSKSSLVDLINYINPA